MFEAFGGTIWSGGSTQSPDNRSNSFLNLGVAAGLGLGAFGYGIHTRNDGWRGIDSFSSHARTLGNLSPLQLANTLRIPEFLSPFTSPKSKNLSLANNLYSMTWDSAALNSSSTYSYLKELTGLDDSQLTARGIRSKGSTASSVVFEQLPDSIAGRLYSKVGNTTHLLHENVMLMQYTGERNNIVNALGNAPESIPINRAIKSVFSSMNMSKYSDFKDYSVLSDGKIRPTFIPIPGMSLSLRGTSYARSLGAFQMERFNHLISNVGSELFGKGFDRTISKVFGAAPEVISGPASSMLFRFGGKAAAIGGIGLGVAELDYMRRQGGGAGHIAASGLLSAGLGVLATRAGFSGKAGAILSAGSFSAQMLLPGFNKGVIPGIATAYTKLQTARATGLNPFGYYRRTLEGFAPGITSPEFMIGAGITAALLPKLYVPTTGRKIPQVLLDQLGHTTLGFNPKTISGMKVSVPKSVRDIFWDKMFDHANKNLTTNGFADIHKDYMKNGQYSTMSLRNRLRKEYGKTHSSHELSRLMETTFAQAETEFDELAKVNPINHHLTDELSKIATRYTGRSDLLSRAGMQAEGIFSQAKHALFGAALHQDDTAKKIASLGFKSPLGSTGLLFAAAAGIYGLATGGLLGSMESRQELQDIYSGKQLVEVKRGRFWEAGGTPLQGSNTQQLRPHWYPIMMNRALQAGTWGVDEDSIDPLGKFMRSNFTYDLERRNYYDRPYPISSAAFSNIPIVGGILGATIGRIIKPAKIMHPNEWARMGENGMEYASLHDGWKREPSYNTGAYLPGVPLNPYGAANTLSQLQFQTQELGGLTGWLSSLVQKGLTGKPYMYSDSQVLADSSIMTSARRRLWDASLGGLGPVGEVIRRVLPSYPKEIERSNPLLNAMPSWLPDEFWHGDPYTQLPYGEAVLPGAGYAALHKELRGVNPEDYPLIHRYNILAQVAPLSSEFRSTRERIYRARSEGQLTEEQQEYIDKLDTAVNRRWAGVTDDRRDPNAIRLPGSRATSEGWLLGQKFLRKEVAPLEYLIPAGFRPFQKLLGNRDPIEQYEYERMYGSSVAFWDKPVRDWLRPSMYSLFNFMGYQGKPLWRHQADSVNEYFDKAEFYKWTNLANQAASEGNTRDKIRYEYLASNTRMGVNPYGNPLSIYWSLPSEDRMYFNAFSSATGKERERILQMVPSDQVHLYKAIWSRMDSGDEGMWAGGKSSPNRAYLDSQLSHLDTRNLPADDWIGYNSDIDVRDIKVRYVNSIGGEMRDYGLWEKEERKAYSQPQLEGSEEQVSRIAANRGWMMRGMGQMLDTTGLTLNSSNSFYGTMDMSYYDDRYPEINNKIMEQISAY